MQKDVINYNHSHTNIKLINKANFILITENTSKGMDILNHTRYLHLFIELPSRNDVHLSFHHGSKMDTDFDSVDNFLLF